MKKYQLIIAVLFASLSFSCMSGQEKEHQSDKEASKATDQKEDNPYVDKSNDQKIELQINSKNNSNVTGSITFEEKDNKVQMKAELSGLNSGKHAIHLHQNADCSSDDGKSAGGHWNPTNEQHGKWGDEEGYHRGDIGNFEADADGNVTYEFSTEEWCIGCDDEQKNIIGTAVIIHEGEDDFSSQPSGNAGERIACAAIKRD